jgi:glutamyl-tRNA synthetase
MSKMSDISEQFEIFFDDMFDKLEYPELKDGYKDILQRYLEIFNINDDVDTWFSKVKDIAEEFGYAVDRKEYENNTEKYKGNVGDVAMIIRIAVTKKTKTPDLYQIIHVLGEERVRERIGECIRK